jgi:TonB family protein
MAENFINVFEENDLNELLGLWLAPPLPRSLDQRIVRSFVWIRHDHIGIASPRTKPTTLEVSMKRCNACDEEFENKFSFCPVDDTPLNELAAALVNQRSRRDSIAVAPDDERLTKTHSLQRRGEFQVTMIDSSVLFQRLTTELRFTVYQLKQAWPDFKRDPISAGRRGVIQSVDRLRQLSRASNALAGIATALIIVLSAVLIVIILERVAPTHNQFAARHTEDGAQIVMLDFPGQSNPLKGAGVGAGSNGRVGFNRGKGEGSESEPKPSRGGGGGGTHDPLPQQQGRLPQPSAIPATIPKLPPVNKATLADAGIDIDPALWKNLPMSVYGDPRSKSTAPSNGSGDGGGMGTGNGPSIGEGNGPGVGPGDDGNIGGEKRSPGGGGIGGAPRGNNPNGPDHVFTNPQVEQRARVLSKPEPQYTEEARKHDVTGTVILRVVFSTSGEVTDIRTVKPLPMGLTERAIAAARQIHFVPAMRGGHPVNVYMQLEYNFNLY